MILRLVNDSNIFSYIIKICEGWKDAGITVPDISILTEFDTILVDAFFKVKVTMVGARK